GFGISAPEILVSGTAALEGNPGLAIGNALGSNIANIGLILGVTALVIPLSIHSRTLQREYPVLLAVSLVTWMLMADGSLDLIDGMVLLAGLAGVIFWMIRLALSGGPVEDPMVAEFEAEIPHAVPTPKATLLLLLGLAALLVSSKTLVWGASNIAEAFGVSDLVIGLTIVALGTSLPELAASITSAFKGEDDIALGNIIGSNMYNLLAVLSLPGVFAPGLFAPEVLTRDLPMMMGLTVAVFLIGYGFIGAKRRINRFEGILLLSAFIGYQSVLFYQLSGQATQ
ncbi:MAG TPA: calcium/sodium antiporter, partial [Chromatiales bacterium]|nr:calcium/sodium antiporter [Chromatiales bacterium]